MKLSDQLKAKCEFDDTNNARFDLLWKMGARAENARLREQIQKILPVIEAAEMGDTRYRYMDHNGQECEGDYLTEAIAQAKKLMEGKNG